MKNIGLDIVFYHDPSIDDGYPEILKSEIENPRYRIIYDEGGKPIRRIEPEDTNQENINFI